jgi:hypothetical protein
MCTEAVNGSRISNVCTVTVPILKLAFEQNESAETNQLVEATNCGRGRSRLVEATGISVLEN